MSEASSPRQRLLLIEDDPAILAVLTDCFEQEDYEVRGVAHLASGLELLQREPVDLILTDLFAPVFSPAALTDLDVFRKVAAATPVILMTAHAEAGQIDPAQYGLAAIILKPFELDAVLACIREALDQQWDSEDLSESLPSDSQDPSAC